MRRFYRILNTIIKIFWNIGAFYLHIQYKNVRCAEGVLEAETKLYLGAVHTKSWNTFLSLYSAVQIGEKR